MSPNTEMSDEVPSGDGWTTGSLDALGSGPGFRKIRAALGVTEFGVNAIVLPGGYETDFHYHDRQQELYFVHSGVLEITFGDGSSQRLEPGGLARVDAATPRMLRAIGDDDAVYVIVGAAEGYVGRDGHQVDPSAQRVRQTP